MRDLSNYPLWYRTFRAFVVGTALGAVSVLVWIAHSEPSALALSHAYVWPAIIDSGLFVILGGFEIVFGIARYRRLAAQQRRSVIL